MLQNIIGQEKIKRYFSTEIKNDTLSYGYIIEGNRFMGKSYIARQIAEEITSNLYITVLTPTNDRKHIHIDDIRDMKNDAYSQTFGKSKKVYILPDADEMSPQAQNAFLKVLEEPPQDCVFILLAVNRYNLLSTIKSRCTTLSLSRYTDAEIKAYLTKAGLNYDTEIVRLCDGTINKYVYLTSKEFTEVNELATRILLNIKTLHPARIFAIFKHIKKHDKYVRDVLDLFLLWYRDLFIYSVLKDESYIEASSKVQSIKDQIKHYSQEELLNIITQIEFARLKLDYNGNLEMTMNTLLLYMGGVI